MRGGYATFEGKSYKENHKVANPEIACGIIDSPGDVGGWPELKSTAALMDSDHDGMPDGWEEANNPDEHNPADRNNFAADGYTMLEKYLNGIR